MTKQQVFCTCREPDNGSWMIGCDLCDEWFHGKCIKMDPEYEDLILHYYCHQCEISSGKETTWKRKCRLPNCKKPADELNKSKYCSPAHGILFFRSIVDKVSDKDSLVLIKDINNNYPHWKRLGDDVPDVKPCELPKPIALQAQDIEIQRLQLLQNKQEMERRIKIFERLVKDSTTRKPNLCGFNKVLLFDDDGDDDDNDVCLVEKRKCTRHSGWQTIINDDISLNLKVVVDQLDKLEKKSNDINEWIRLH